MRIYAKRRNIEGNRESPTPLAFMVNVLVFVLHVPISYIAFSPRTKSANGMLRIPTIRIRRESWKKVFGDISLFEALDDARPGVSLVSTFNANIGQFESLLHNANVTMEMPDSGETGNVGAGENPLQQAKNIFPVPSCRD